MIKIIKPKKKSEYVENVYAPKMRADYLSVINRGVKSFSLTFMLCGYGVKVSGYSLIIATILAAILFDGANVIQAPLLAYIPMVFAGGFLTLAMISLLMTVVNHIINIPNYVMINFNNR